MKDRFCVIVAFAIGLFIQNCKGTPAESYQDAPPLATEHEYDEPPQQTTIIQPPVNVENPSVTNYVFVQNVIQAPPPIPLAYPVPVPSYPAVGEPYPIAQVNHGISTVLHGVKSGDMNQILRGSFIFPTDNNVKSVANTVLDSLFGNQQYPYG